ncbi:type VII secretion-associated serine protease mycosin [Actinomadura sp. HBU206391]|uniref:type VII secretion-associated serine protease mycosin n=1 Tax=Actinomadura sp. HBU206391 TaxID=2731692 RepID=UPI00165057CE|nr:type VII secretion-associated serine protease mycosin [Actinomadura sp. HBU206391]MBC6457974.1 type VII secretion-associated serine protease mycosin [Actinomadura sp. HBU206391]
MRGTRVLAIGGGLALASLGWAPPAVAGQVAQAQVERFAAAPSCTLQQTGSPATEMKSEPWPQQRLNFADVWDLTRGGGVTVAVVDSGVDASHPQLRGRVRTYDVTKTGPQDCLGHGTRVAGIIAARDMRKENVAFIGVAPQAKLISVKMAVSSSGDNDPRWVADAIRRSADLGAKVINVSSQTPNYPFLKAAVEYAQGKDALIVAAAGNLKDAKQTAQQAYPASYPGVMAVGGINPNGSLADFSNSETHVTITAPGKDIISTWPNGAYFNESGTSWAAPYVAGTAALVRSYHPKLTAAQVKDRIERTADGGTVKGTGAGLVNPLRAVTAVLGNEGAGASTQPTVRRVAIAQPQEGDHFGRNLALSLAGGALVLAAATAVAGAAIPASRRRSEAARSEEPASR